MTRTSDFKMNSITGFENTVAKLPFEAPRRDPCRQPTKRPGQRQHRLPEVDAMEEDLQLPGIGTMARTKRLILAALRVWELKRGIRD
jgi:hypothetical protein